MRNVFCCGFLRLMKSLESDSFWCHSPGLLWILFFSISRTLCIGHWIEINQKFYYSYFSCVWHVTVLHVKKQQCCGSVYFSSKGSESFLFLLGNTDPHSSAVSSQDMNVDELLITEDADSTKCKASKHLDDFLQVFSTE